MEKQKIGIFPGSFDPFHIGHLAVAATAYNNGLDKIFVLPAWQNPWKEKSTDYWARLTMCELMTQDYDFIEVSHLEGLMRNEYTYQALQRIKETRFLGDDLYIVAGGDTINKIREWRKGDWIINNFKIMGVGRPGSEYVDGNGIGISSTEIRDMIKKSLVPMPYVDTKTFEYIKNNKLYTND